MPRRLDPPQRPRLEDETPAEATLDSLEEVRLVDPDLSGGRARGLKMLDVVVERGNLANLDAPELSLRRASLSGVRLTGVQWIRGRIVDAVFRDCLLDLA